MPTDDPVPAPSAPADRDELFRQWARWFQYLARRYLSGLAPHDPTWFDVEDLAQEFTRIAAQRFPKWNRARQTFAAFVKDAAGSHARYLRSKARRLMRCAVAVSGTDADRRDWIDRAVSGREPEPWQVLAERESEIGWR